jgi:hypothetical protein
MLNFLHLNPLNSCVALLVTWKVLSKMLLNVGPNNRVHIFYFAMDLFCLAASFNDHMNDAWSIISNNAHEAFRI